MDTDSSLVMQAGREITAIVAEHGWDHFRRLERECLANIAINSQQVVATGGGVVLDQPNLRVMNNTGVVVWLKASADTIRQRMLNDTQTDSQRPALTHASAVDEIEAVLQVRIPLYQKASDITLATDRGSVQILVDQLMALLGAEIGTIEK